MTTISACPAIAAPTLLLWADNDPMSPVASASISPSAGPGLACMS